MVFRRSRFRWVQTHIFNFVVNVPKFTAFFAYAGGIVVDHVFPILNIPIRSGDIRDRSLKESEITPNFGHLLASQLVGVRAPIRFVHPIMTHASLRITWQCFAKLLPLATKLMRLIGRTEARTHLMGQDRLGAEIRSTEKVDLGG